MTNRATVGLVLGALVALLLVMSAFTVRQTEMAIKFQFGEIVNSDYSPGLHFMLPFVNNVRKFDKRILTRSYPDESFLTSEGKILRIDFFIKWRIRDASDYYQATAGNEELGGNRLGEIVKDGIKGAIARRTIQQVVAGSDRDVNNRLNVGDQKPAVTDAAKSDAAPTPPAAATTDATATTDAAATNDAQDKRATDTKAASDAKAPDVKVATNTNVNTKAKEMPTDRSALMQEVIDAAESAASQLGVTIVDVRVKGINLPKEVSESVFKRMGEDFNRQATLLRAEGESTSKRVRAEADRKRKERIADAYREAEIIRGEGDAKAAKLYADAYSKDPEFYSFYRSLQAYRQSLGNDDVLVVSPDSEFFRYLFKYSNRPK